MRIAIFTLLLGIWAFPTSAFAQCFSDHDRVRTFLEGKYQEAPIGRGITANGGILELYASEEGSFTVILRTPPGLNSGSHSCYMVGGHDWQVLKGLIGPGT